MYSHLSIFLSFIEPVKQGLYLPSFEERGVKIDGKCTEITRSLSQALLLQSDKSFLSNLETSAEIYERIARGKQVSKREEREVFAFSKLLNNFERQLDSATNSLPNQLLNTPPKHSIIMFYTTGRMTNVNIGPLSPVLITGIHGKQN